MNDNNDNNDRTNLKESAILLVDTDAAITYWKEKNLPVIAWSHAYNQEESLMGARWMILSLDALTEDYLGEVYCRYKNLPLTVCQTKRCYLRELTVNDLENVLALDAEQTVNSAGRFFPADSMGDVQSYLTEYIRCQYPFYGYGIYAAFDSATDHFLGIAGFAALPESSSESVPESVPESEESPLGYGVTPVLEIGYAVKKEFRSNGYATEWIRALLNYAKEALEISPEEVVARIERDNIASIRTATGCGISILYHP